MPDFPSLIPPTANAELELALRDRLQRRNDAAGGFGELEPLALRLGLMQATTAPAFRHPQLLVFASDHGLAVDGIIGPRRATTAALVQQLLAGQTPLAAFARHQGMALTVVDAGVADRLPAARGLLARKIAHGTRNARVGPAMTSEQVHAALRAGIELAHGLPGNAVGCAALGVGADEAAALVLSRLGRLPVRDLLVSGPRMSQHTLAHLMLIAQAAQGRHKDVHDPVEVLAAFGGFETAMMAGLMLGAAQRRCLILVDGLPACAALLAASKVDAAVLDYTLFCRSHAHLGLDRALGLFCATALLELGLHTGDGCGAALAWPLVNCAAALLSDVADPPPPVLDEDDSTAPQSEPAALG